MSNDRKSQTSDSDKKLRLSRETVRNLRVKTDMKTGWRASDGCPSSFPTLGVGCAPSQTCSVLVCAM